jgi:hypothetical protein
MSKRRKLEKEKLRKNALMADGYGMGISISHGIVIGADGMSVAGNLSSHGLLVPWGSDPHIKILLNAD